ncbi:MAG: hypothetical protein KDD64_04570 [Bdellovibrionales bacterium]|nr:hypothetical protein [Bdellovibrionales bacterium]
MKRFKKESEYGYTLLGVLLLLSIGLIVSAGMIDTAGSNTKTRALVKTRSEYYYQVEETLNRTVAWLQQNSKYLVSAFRGSDFTTNFDLGSPSLGSNEGEHFGVPTMVKMKGTNNSVMLSNNAFFGESAFPSLEHIDTSAAFDPISSFESADLGEANARVILVWARETDSNYEPIFRVDVVTGNNPDRGVHSFSFVYSTLVASGGDMGFYGRDHFTTGTGNDCYSYQYVHDGSSWSRGAPRANCPVGSDTSIFLKSKINGNAKSLTDDSITLSNPGGDVSGDMCDGAGCHGYALPVVNTWNGYCGASNNGDASISANTTWSTGGCWRDVSISNNKTLNLTDYENPYYFRTLDFGPNNAKVAFGTIPVDKKVTIYVEDFGNDHINGNETYNPNNAPHQVEIYYIGAEDIKLNGNADLNAMVYSPLANVDVQGNFNFYGGIFAKTLDVSGSARINYDEALGAVPVLSDLNFTLKKASQRYR